MQRHEEKYLIDYRQYALLKSRAMEILTPDTHGSSYTITSLYYDDMMDTAGLPLLGVIPEDENVTLAATFNQPLLLYKPRCAAAKACARIAKRITGLPVPIKVR